MNPCLLIFNCRLIEECLDAFEDLTVAKLWIRGRQSPELRWLVPKTMGEHPYTHYLVCPDDVVVSQDAVDAVLALLEADHPIVTGYCNLDLNDHSHLVNLCKTPLVGDTLSVGAYDWYTRAEVDAWPDEAVPTWFGGMTLTAMSRERWLHYGWEHQIPDIGAAADFRLAKKLEAEGTPMVAAKAAFVQHVKDHWPFKDQDPRKTFRHSEIPIEVRYDPARVAA